MASLASLNAEIIDWTSDEVDGEGDRIERTGVAVLFDSPDDGRRMIVEFSNPLDGGDSRWQLGHYTRTGTGLLADLTVNSGAPITINYPDDYSWTGTIDTGDVATT